MAKPCTVCASDHLAQINLAVARGLSLRAVADRYRLSHHAVFRHQRDHLPSELRAALTLKLLVRRGEAGEVALSEGASTIEAVRAIRAPLYSLFLEAVRINDTASAARLAARLHEGLSLSGKLAGELVPVSRVNVTHLVISEHWQRFRAELLAILKRFPEAQTAVAQLFREMGLRAAEEMQRGLPRPANVIDAEAVEVTDAAA